MASSLHKCVCIQDNIKKSYLKKQPVVFICMYVLTGVVCFCVARCAGAGPSARVHVPWAGLTGGGSRGAAEHPRLTWKTLGCICHT